jgi:hypothetical protein
VKGPKNPRGFRKSILSRFLAAVMLNEVLRVADEIILTVQVGPQYRVAFPEWQAAVWKFPIWFERFTRRLHRKSWKMIGREELS